MEPKKPPAAKGAGTFTVNAGSGIAVSFNGAREGHRQPALQADRRHRHRRDRRRHDAVQALDRLRQVRQGAGPESQEHAVGAALGRSGEHRQGPADHPGRGPRRRQALGARAQEARPGQRHADPGALQRQLAAGFLMDGELTAGPRIELTRGDDRIILPIVLRETLIGRIDSNHVVLDDASISRIHAEAGAQRQEGRDRGLRLFPGHPGQRRAHRSRVAEARRCCQARRSELPFPPGLTLKNRF